MSGCRDIFDDRSSNSDHESLLLKRALGMQSEQANELKLHELDAQYKSEEAYIEHYLPLMLLEAKQGIHRAKEMEMTESCGEIVERLCTEIKGEHFLVTIARNPHSQNQYSTGDLVLLYRNAPTDSECPAYKDVFQTRMENELRIDEDDEGNELLETAQAGIVEGGGEDGDKTPAQVTETVAVDGDGRALRAPNPLADNPHHVLGIVDGMSRGNLAIRVLVRDANVSVESLLGESCSTSETNLSAASTQDSTTESDGREELSRRHLASQKRRMIVEFMLLREKYRMNFLAEALADQEDRVWYLAKVMNLVTLYREYQALMSLGSMPLLDYLLTPGDTIVTSKKRKRTKKRRRRHQVDTFNIPDALNCTLKGMYNTSQLAALQDCLKQDGITCIQGPPGTGKTTTIMGILSVILNAQQTKPNEQDTYAQVRLSPRSEEREARMADEIPQAQKAAKLMPWLTDDTYSPWYDTQRTQLEELEDPTPIPNAIKSGVFVDLVRSQEIELPRKVLVCAPSNAAVDEILRRLVADPRKGGGIFDGNGQRYNPQVLRMGPGCHAELKKHSIQERVKGRLEAFANSAGTHTEESIKTALLEEASIVCATLSVTGSRELTAFADGFDTVVVDEASQGVEMSTLIPLKLQCRRLILVGDPRQLPATVFSKVALDLKYDQSLFQRLERAGHHINMLSVQYRMHPAISAFPSKAFYDGALLDWEGVEASCQPPMPYFDIPIFKPVVLFSLDSEDQAENTSRINKQEAQFIVQIVDMLKCLFPYLPKYRDNWTEKIGIISPYAEQVKLISKHLKALLGVDPRDPCPIDVNTVDSFQGREKDLVIFSAVRSQYVGDKVAATKANVGFLADQRRMNVALTRARLNMWVVGNGRYLQANPQWGKFVNFCNEKQHTFNVNYARTSEEGFLKHYLVNYLGRVPKAKEVFAKHVPEFLQRIHDDVALLTSAQAERQRLDEAFANKDYNQVDN